MRILLDTHVFLWWVNDDKQLSSNARQKIERAESVHISAISFWEMVIKQQLGKLDVNMDDLFDCVIESGFTELPMKAHHAIVLQQLPPLHKDPFDRMLIAQAISEPLHFLTADKTLADYSPLIELV